jgi:hypothetical protein
MKKVVRGCAKKTRQYMVAYLAGHAEKGELNLDGTLYIDNIYKSVSMLSHIPK